MIQTTLLQKLCSLIVPVYVSEALLSKDACTDKIARLSDLLAVA